MSKMRCSAGAVVAAVLLFDVAPSPSCGSGRRYDTAFLYVSALDCSCAPGTIRVTIDDRFAAELRCGTNGVAIEVRTGSHAVAASSGSLSWPPRAQAAVAGRTTPVELGCPSPP